MVTIEKEKLQKLVDNFYKMYGICDECDVYEHEGLGVSAETMYEWVDENIGRDLQKIENKIK